MEGMGLLHSGLPAVSQATKPNFLDRMTDDL
jgi:hypothetical protein